MSTVTLGPKSNNMRAHAEWRDRPADERFWSLDDLNLTLQGERERSKEATVPSRYIRPSVHEGNVVLNGSKGPIGLTHWSMGQLAQIAKVPASYLRDELYDNPDLAVANIRNGLDKHTTKNDGDTRQLLLTHQPGDHTNIQLRSLTTAYSRLWDSEIIKMLTPALDHGWMVPPARPALDDPRARPATLADIVPQQDSFGLSVRVGDMIGPAGVYRGDRNLFVFVVNPNRIIDLDGGNGLMRGAYIYNSEVRDGAFSVETFYLENVCGNHIVWGCTGLSKFRVVHKGNNFRSLPSKLNGQLVRFGNADTTNERRMIEAAKNYTLGSNKAEVVATLGNLKKLALPEKVIDVTYEVAVEFEHTANAAPNTMWGMSHALTRYSQRFGNADVRNGLDEKAGQMLQMAYASRN
jgi:hypothetical protein